MVSESLENVFENMGFGKFQYMIVILCGILQSFDAIEMLILAFIQQVLRCVWQATVWEESFLVTSVFIGMMIGSPIFGKIGDLYGRKSVLVISCCLLVYLGLLCSASPTIVWLTIIRTLVGACLGGVVSALATLASELMPIQNRGSALILILGFWPLGSYIVTIFCITIVPSLGWRGFLAISSLPLLCALPFLAWLPESPRFLLLKNRKKEALVVINKIAKINHSAPITDVIQTIDSPYSIWDVFHKNYYFTTIILAFLWCVAGLTYYGIILIVTEIDMIPRQCLQNMNMYHKQSFNSTTNLDHSCCTPITWSNSIDVFISTTGELVFIPITFLMISVIGRKYSLAIFYLSIVITFIIINFCMPPFVLSAFLFLLRGCIAGMFNVIFIYTSEVYPTSVRSLAFGLCSTSSRLGSILSPFINNFIILRSSFFVGTLIFSFFNSMAFVAALMLPYETMSRPLFQTADEYIMLQN